MQIFEDDKEVYKRAQEMRENIGMCSEHWKIKEHGVVCDLIANKTPCYRSIAETAKLIDANKAAEACIKHKIEQHWHMIDLEEILNTSASTSTIKCSAGLNPCGAYQHAINSKNITNKCQRCRQIESREHVIACPVILNLKHEFAKNISNGTKVEKI